MYFGHFKGLWVFWPFYSFEGISIFFKFRGHFDHFLGLWGLLVIFRFRGYFNHF